MARVLPRDIIIEILLRLPVTSLLRFRRVSKSWKILITSPMFAFRHIHLQNSLVSTSNRFVIIKCPNSPHLYRVNFDTLLSDSVKIYLPASFFKPPYDRVVLTGSCNGLICLYSFVEGKIILLNPITLTYFQATTADLPLETRSVGFGFDSINRDYKFVCNSHYKAMVYSFKKKSWKCIDPKYGEYIFLNMAVGALVNNHVLHWIVRLHGSPTTMVACFDLCTEQWSLISLPKYVDFKHRPKLSVHENGYLCLSIIYKNHSYQQMVDIWMLKEYAMKEYWVKIRVSRYRPFPSSITPFYYNKDVFPGVNALHKSENWYAEICTGSLVTLRDGKKFSWKHRLSKAFACLKP